MSVRRALVVLLCVSLPGVAPPGDARAATPGTDGPLSFHTAGSWEAAENPGSFSMEADGTDRRQVHSTARQISWAPDGQAYAGVSSPSGANEVRRFTSVDDPGTQLGRGVHPRWSPSGDRIGFISNLDYDSGGDLVVVPATGGAPSTVMRAVWAFDWSPDGSHVVAHVGDHLVIARSDGTAARKLDLAGRTPYRSYIGPLISWSPTGDRLALVLSEGHHLATVSVCGGTPAVLPVVMDLEAVVWSPSGTRIAVSQQQNEEYDETDNGEIYVMNADGSNPRNVTQSRRSWEVLSDWAPRVAKAAAPDADADGSPDAQDPFPNEACRAADAPPAAPQPPPPPPVPPQPRDPLPLECAGRGILIDGVVRRGRRVIVTGIVVRRLIGSQVTVTGPQGARAVTTARADATFSVTLPAPAKSVRRARYSGAVGAERSRAYQLDRYFSIVARKGRMVEAQLTGRRRARVRIELLRDVSCRRRVVVRRARTNRRGRVRFVLPKADAGTVVSYRLSPTSRRTYTVPVVLTG